MKLFRSFSKKRGSFYSFMLAILAGLMVFTTGRGMAGELSKELVEAAKKEGSLMYWGTDAETAPKFVKGFEKKYPFMKGKIKFWDAKTHEVVERVITEAKAGRHSADFVSIGEDWFNRLTDAGLIAKVEWSNVKSWKTKVQPNHGLWANVAIDPRPAIYNTKLISNPPRSFEDLVNPKFKGLSALSDASEEFPFVYAYLWRKGNKLNWEKSFDYFRRLVKATKPAVVRGYTGPTRLLAAGEFGVFHIGIFSRAYQMINKGAPVGLVALNPMYGGVRSFGILKNAPHPSAARLYAHWITSIEGSVAYSDLLGKFPYNPMAKNAKPVKVAKKYGITPDGLARIPTKAWTKDRQKKSETFYYKLMGLK